MDKSFWGRSGSERFLDIDPPPAEEDVSALDKAGRKSTPTSLPLLLIGSAVVSLALALGSWQRSEGEGGELSRAVEVLVEAIEDEREGIGEY